ncbi:MAG TPA: hypothetical protein DEF36_03330 [Desulfotomaculum sp.]|nr:hypothetical protein [Desulfotomaculum sp.]
MISGATIAQGNISLLVNPEMAGLIGCSANEITGGNFYDFIYTEDLDRVKKEISFLPAAGEEFYSWLRVVCLDGSIKKVKVSFSLVEYPGGPAILVSALDITDRVRKKGIKSKNIWAGDRVAKLKKEITSLEEECTLQKVYFQQLFENSPDAIAIVDGSGAFIRVNRVFENIFQYSIADIKGFPAQSFIVPESLIEEEDSFLERVLGGQAIKFDTVRQGRNGIKVDVALQGVPIAVKGKNVGAYIIYTDISGRKQAEEKLMYLSWHDSLTGLYNRAYFEEEMTRLQYIGPYPISIILCDVDGLKFVNDALGNYAGDALLVTVSTIIKDSFQSGEIVSRVGGGEFAVLLPGGDSSIVKEACRRILAAVDGYNGSGPRYPLSLSVGIATRDEPASLAELFREADNNMYREKLHRSQSARSSIVQALTKALEARDFITEGHADRLQDLVASLGKTAGLPHSAITDLRLLARFHDIGKVGIPDRILFKPGPLTLEEYGEMKRHSEIGYRIAQSAPELAPISDWILKHHEWWNGQGYPMGLKGDQIPLECRILSIADTYDAMTSDRPYRRAMTHEAAVKELKKCSGTQLDPNLIPLFLEAFRSRNSGSNNKPLSGDHIKQKAK